MKSVDAVSKSEIEVIHNQLKLNHPPIYADIWRIGCNMGLRISDLLALKFEQLDTEQQQVNLIESKTGKPKAVRLNTIANEIIIKRRKNYPDDVYLFQVHSNRAKGQAISRVSVSRRFKTVGDKLNLHIGTHTMRKSRGKAMYEDGVPIAVIAKVLNHSTEAATLRYLGITEEQVLQTYDDYEL